jgi:hypothetical protein
MKFSPFDDTQFHVRPPSPTESGYDTSGWDLYRQGIELSRDKFRFMGSQPKMWSGETSGFSAIVTYGQEPGTIEGNGVGLESKFEDLPEFNPVAFISLGVSYPLPIVFNNGPSEELEATIEPLTIPFKKPSNEGLYCAHAIHGSYEDGNFGGYVVKSTNLIEQFVDLTTVNSTRFFLDEGGDSFGTVTRDPFIADVGMVPLPFDDTLSYSPEKKLHTSSSVFHEVAREGFEMGEVDLIPYGKKSAAAGASYYGLNAGQYGTDSIAFAGWSLGS